MNLLSVTRHELGTRVHLGGARVHHGLVGLALVAIGLRLMWSDRSDFPWLSDY